MLGLMLDLYNNFYVITTLFDLTLIMSSLMTLTLLWCIMMSIYSIVDVLLGKNKITQKYTNFII